jgi:hypothetical protein
MTSSYMKKSSDSIYRYCIADLAPVPRLIRKLDTIENQLVHLSDECHQYEHTFILC